MWTVKYGRSGFIRGWATRATPARDKRYELIISVLPCRLWGGQSPTKDKKRLRRRASGWGGHFSHFQRLRNIALNFMEVKYDCGKSPLIRHSNLALFALYYIKVPKSQLKVMSSFSDFSRHDIGPINSVLPTQLYFRLSTKICLYASFIPYILFFVSCLQPLCLCYKHRIELPRVAGLWVGRRWKRSSEAAQIIKG